MISVKTNVKDDENITVKEKNKFPCIGVYTDNGRQHVVMFITDTVGIVIKDDKFYKEGYIRTDWPSAAAFIYMPINTSATITVINE